MEKPDVHNASWATKQYEDCCEPLAIDGAQCPPPHYSGSCASKIVKQKAAVSMHLGLKCRPVATGEAVVRPAYLTAHQLADLRY